MAACSSGSAMSTGHPPSASRKSSGGEDLPSAVAGLFCICSVRKSEGVLLWLYRRVKSRGCFMARGSWHREESVPDAAYSKGWQHGVAPLHRRAAVSTALQKS